MSSQPNNLPQNTIDAQANSASATASDGRITQEMNDCVLPVHDNDKSYLRILLAMCHPLGVPHNL